MAIQKPFNLHQWVEENRDTLKPPVGNKNLYKDVEITVKFREPYGTKKIMKNRAPIKITSVKQSEDFESPEDYYGI